MTDPCLLTTPQGRSIAYDRIGGRGPGVVFLHGLRSDMTGTKALALADWARRTGRAFLRFDCSGHGRSSGRFEDGAIGDWFEDALAALTQLTEGPQVLVGSSMGGWLALLLARAVPDRVRGLVGIAAAPDFTEDGIWAGATGEHRRALMTDGFFQLPGEYREDPTVITRRLIEEGRAHLVLREPLTLPFPVRLLHGTDDTVVPPAVALRLLDHAQSPDLHLTLVKGADHRFSSPACLARVEASGTDLS